MKRTHPLEEQRSLPDHADQHLPVLLYRLAYIYVVTVQRVRYIISIHFPAKVRPEDRHGNGVSTRWWSMKRQRGRPPFTDVQPAGTRPYTYVVVIVFGPALTII